MRNIKLEIRLQRETQDDVETRRISMEIAPIFYECIQPLPSRDEGLENSARERQIEEREKMVSKLTPDIQTMLHLLLSKQDPKPVSSRAKEE